MVTRHQVDAHGKRHSPVYSGIFNNKVFREGGRLAAKAGPAARSEGFREDVFSESSGLRVEMCKSRPPLDAASCVCHAIREKCSSQQDVAWMNTKQESSHGGNAELKPLSHEHCTKQSPHMQNNVGSCTATYTKLQYDVNHHEELSSTCTQAKETPSPRTSFASVNNISRWKKVWKSTAPENEHVLPLHEKPNEPDASSSSSHVLIMSQKESVYQRSHPVGASCSPEGRKLPTSGGQLGGPLLASSKAPKESTDAGKFVRGFNTSVAVNGAHIEESSKRLSGMQKPGDTTWDSRVYKPGKQQEATGRGSTNGVDTSSGGNHLEWSHQIGDPIFWDSSSSYGGSSSSGSPVASVALRNSRSLNGKGSPYSVSSRSMGSAIGYGYTGNPGLSPTSSNGSPNSHLQWSAKNHDQMMIKRMSNDMATNRYDRLKGVDTYVTTSNMWADTGRSVAGEHPPHGRDAAAIKPGNLLRNANLLVGGMYGNILSYGGGTKRNTTQEEAVDHSLLKKAQASLDSEDVKNAGNNYYKAGHLSEALTLYDRAISICPSNAMYRSCRAAALSGLGRYGEAVKECEKAISLDCSYAPAHVHVASLYTRLGLMEKAKQHLYAAGEPSDFIELQRLGQIERHFSRCIEARKLEDWHNVIRESDAAVVAGADSAPQIFGFKAEALLRLNKLEDADSVCSTAQRIESSMIEQGISSKDFLLQLTRAQVNLALGRFEEAVGAAECVLRIDPSNASATAFLLKSRAVLRARNTGNGLFKAGCLFEALALYTEGLENDPKNALLLCNRAACRLKLCQWEKAVEDCDASLRLRPHYTKARLRRASCLTKLECWKDALQDYEILQRELPGDVEVARGLFDLQVAMKKSRGEEIHGMKFGGDMKEVTSDKQFREAVGFPGLSIVQFAARWSDRCRELLPFIDGLCRCHPGVNFVKVDVQELPYLAKIENINFIPTFKLYKNAKKLKEMIGPSEQSLDYAVKHYSL